jgi:hypothetical protein
MTATNDELFLQLVTAVAKKLLALGERVDALEKINVVADTRRINLADDCEKLFVILDTLPSPKLD